MIIRAAILAGAAFLTLPTATLKVTMYGFRTDSGKVGVTVYEKQNAKAFPTNPDMAIRRSIVNVKDGMAETVFKNLPYGTYAVAIVHDENNNDDLDLKWYGAPDEGTGASNDPKPIIGPPSFEQAQFPLKEKNLEIFIQPVYW